MAKREDLGKVAADGCVWAGHSERRAGRKQEGRRGQWGSAGDSSWRAGIPTSTWKQPGSVLVSETSSVYSCRQGGVPTAFLLNLCWSQRGLETYRAGWWSAPGRWPGGHTGKGSDSEALRSEAPAGTEAPPRRRSAGSPWGPAGRGASCGPSTRSRGGSQAVLCGGGLGPGGFGLVSPLGGFHHLD